MEEKTRYQKISLNIMDKNARVSLTRDVKILDITPEDITLEASKKLDMGRIYALEIKYNGTVITTNCIVMWSLVRISSSEKEGKKNPILIHKVGMKLTNVSQEEIKDLFRFIKKHKEHVKNV
jgi:hypothetical protein